MLHGGVHVQPLRGGLLAGDDDIDVVAAAQAMVGDGQQSIRVRREIDPDDFTLLIHDVVDEAGILVAEPIVILPPDMRREKVVEGRNGPSPRDMPRHLEPLGVLVEHRVDDVDERLVATEEAVPPRQEIAFQPALTLMFTQHLHDAPLGRNVVVSSEELGRRATTRHLEHRAPPVGRGLIGAEDTKVRRIELEHVADELALGPRGLRLDGTGLRHLDRVVAEVREPQVAQQGTAVGVWVGAHATLAPGCEFRQFRDEPSVRVEQLARTIALEPSLQELHMTRVAHVSHRHLMGAEGAFGPFAIDHLWPSPTFGRTQNNHGPARASFESLRPGLALDVLNIADHRVERGRHLLVHRRRLVALDEVRLVTVAAKQRLQFVAWDAGQHGRPGNLVAVQVQDGQNRAVMDWIQKLVRVPARGQRAGLRFAIPHDAGDQQVGIVEGRAVSVREGIAEFPALVNRTGRLRRDMTGNAARKGKLLEQSLQSVGILGDVRINFAVGSFEIRVSDQPRPAVARPGDVEDVQVVLLDHAIQVDIDEVQPRCRAPMAEQAQFDVLQTKRLPQKRIVKKIDLTDGEVVCSAPVGVHFSEQVRAE